MTRDANSPANQSLRGEMARKRRKTLEKFLPRGVEPPVTDDAIAAAQREATEARRLADEAKRRARR